MNDIADIAREPRAADAPNISTPIDYKIICADSHVNPPHDFWHHDMSAKWKDDLPYVEEAGDADTYPVANAQSQSSFQSPLFFVLS
ncbi:hypothetical protein [Blastomonas aquatica]|uniref:Amidohydrolase-related domain-containing protein n=1 Tax=Blastomonas aquatica TaxID=1510276 RepID=A0ABQ1JS47_9SPHN|nr:hypothetical protein [Blastomonas aquatica]GGB72903.1 hypothetical protein GCM10010833_30120 [Blastomonas aquatica]